MMARAIVRTEKKRGRGRPPTHAKSIHLTLKPDVLDALDAFRAGESDNPSRPEAARRLLADSLTGLGYLDAEDD
jgi:hypothetical protein